MRLNEASLIPDTIFGVLTSVHVVLPGSILSGLYPRKKSSPAVRPEPSSRIGHTISSVVPGYVDDSSTTVDPGRTNRERLRDASSM